MSSVCLTIARYSSAHHVTRHLGALVLVADIGPEQSLNRNSNFIQSMFIVCSYSIQCHTSFKLYSCSVRIVKESSGSVQTRAQYVQRVFMKKYQPRRPKRLCSAFVRSLFRLKVAFKACSDNVHIFTHRSFSVQIQSLFIFLTVLIWKK